MGETEQFNMILMKEDSKHPLRRERLKNRLGNEAIFILEKFLRIRADPKMLLMQQGLMPEQKILGKYFQSLFNDFMMITSLI